MKKQNLHNKPLLDIAESMELKDVEHQQPQHEQNIRRKSVDKETLNKSMACEDHVASYRDYLRAQRTLKSMRGFSQRSINATGEIIDLAQLTPPSSPLEEAKHEQNQEQQQQQPENERANGLGRTREQQSDDAYRQSIRNIAVAGRRSSMMSNDTALWDALMEMDEDMGIDESLENEKKKKQSDQKEEDAIADDHHNNQHKIGVIPWYAPPMQRVFYGKPQVLPHVNWGDLFFDLFFVAAAYNLGAMLMSAMNADDWLRGLIYFVGIFGALYQTWYNDLAFSSRYTVLDHVHRLVGGMKFFSVAIAIMFIKQLSFMSDPKSVETLAFLIAIVSESIINLSLNVDVYFKAIGDRTPIETHTKRKITNNHLPTLALYSIALALAAIAYLETSDDNYYGEDVDAVEGVANETSRTLAAATSDLECSSGSRLLLSRMLGASAVACPSDDHRILADAIPDDSCSCHTGIKLTMADLPLGIVAFTYIFNIAFSFVRSLCLAGEGKDIRDRFVPNNLDYLIHRYGEWILYVLNLAFCDHQISLDAHLTSLYCFTI
jgi:hypothetical protein